MTFEKLIRRALIGVAVVALSSFWAVGPVIASPLPVAVGLGREENPPQCEVVARTPTHFGTEVEAEARYTCSGSLIALRGNPGTATVDYGLCIRSLSLTDRVGWSSTCVSESAELTVNNFAMAAYLPHTAPCVTGTVYKAYGYITILVARTSSVGDEVMKEFDTAESESGPSTFVC
jgi:hypothetical protein